MNDRAGDLGAAALAGEAQQLAAAAHGAIL
jgi:hypothetical protein